MNVPSGAASSSDILKYVPTLIILALGVITLFIVLPKLKSKVSRMENRLSPTEQEAIKSLDQPLKKFVKISNKIINIGIITLSLLLIVYLLTMFFLVPR